MHICKDRPSDIVHTCIYPLQHQMKCKNLNCIIAKLFFKEDYVLKSCKSYPVT